jgi:hypothetical protein
VPQFDFSSCDYAAKFLMRSTGWRLFLVLGLLLFAALPARADRVELTNNSAVSVDGVTRHTPPNFMAVMRTVNITGGEAAFGDGIVQDVNITIDFSKLSNPNDFVPQPWYNEIGFALKSPSGTLIDLIPVDTFLDPFDVPFIFDNTPGFDGIVTFDDAATLAVNNGPIAGRPNAGTFQPIDALSAFDGESAQGTWELWIEDSTGANPLTVNSFTLSVQTGPAVVPEPGSLILGGTSLLAMLGFAWRKRCIS